jgi:2'-hydroxyisoflavone reductase
LEQKIVGIYNVTGPATPLSMKGMVEDVRTGTASQVDCVWIDKDFLDSHGVKDGQFPLYAPPTGDTAGFNRCNCSRALARGLTFRPLTETARATLDWYRSLPPNLQAAVAPQFVKRPNEDPWLETEKHLLESWNLRARK